ncbi:MAG: hypothetical protein M3N59_01860 [bacterium]|nr:hypothetical protein [bacterium]
MEGKGWFLVYGALLLIVVYLVFSVASLSGKVNELQADVAALNDQAGTIEASPEPDGSETASPEPSPTSDLTTPAGRDVQRKQDLNEITAALAAYYAERKAYPGNLAELTTQYLEQIPTDPSYPQFDYRYRREGSGFILTSVLEQENDPADTAGDGRADKIMTLRGQEGSTDGNPS